MESPCSRHPWHLRCQPVPRTGHSDNSMMPSSWPSRPSAAHGVWRGRRAWSSARRKSANAHPDPTLAALASADSTRPPPAKAITTKSRRELWRGGNPGACDWHRPGCRDRERGTRRRRREATPTAARRAAGDRLRGGAKRRIAGAKSSPVRARVTCSARCRSGLRPST